MLEHLDFSYRNTFLSDDKKSMSDIANYPELFRSIDPSFVQRVQSLVELIDVDLDNPLSPEDDSLDKFPG